MTDPIEVTSWLKRRWQREKDKRRVRKALLEQFPEIVGRDPIELLHNALRDPLGNATREIEDALDNYYEYLAAKKTRGARRSAVRWYNTIRGFYTDSGVRFSKYPKKFHPPPPPTFTPTQEEVKRMVRTRQDPQDKAVIAFLAQTGQKAGALIAMKWKFIHIVDERGVVHVKPEEFKNRKGELAYLSKDEYVFIMGRDVMGLLGKAPKDKEKWLFDISERTISRIVKKAAEDAGIEERVTPNTFRGYWRAQMAKGGVWQDTLLEYMMGYQIPRRETRSGYLSWQNLLEEYRKDESRLEV